MNGEREREKQGIGRKEKGWLVVVKAALCGIAPVEFSRERCGVIEPGGWTGWTRTRERGSNGASERDRTGEQSEQERVEQALMSGFSQELFRHDGTHTAQTCARVRVRDEARRRSKVTRAAAACWYQGSVRASFVCAKFLGRMVKPGSPAAGRSNGSGSGFRRDLC